MKPMNWFAISVLLLLVACEKQNGDPVPSVENPLSDSTGTEVFSTEGDSMKLDFAETFSAVQRGDMWVVDLKASITSWGGDATGPEQRARMLLVPKGSAIPPLDGDLEGAQVIQIPVERIAVNLAPFEAMLTALDVDDRLVAVGGPKSYNDAIRQRVSDGELAQIGYGWHMPPVLDALLGAEPDVLLMAMGDLSHTSQMDRIRELGVQVFPMFMSSEPHYMGRVEYIRLLGLLTGRNEEASDYVSMVAGKVAALKASVTDLSPKSLISSWYSGSGRWMATVRNSEAALLRDANGLNLLEEADDPRQDDVQKLSTEQLILKAADADCAIFRDSHSQAFRDKKTLEQFRAYRNGCVYAIDGMVKPEADAYDYYESAVIRPDLVLRDLVNMLHPELRGDDPFLYIQPDEQLYD